MKPFDPCLDIELLDHPLGFRYGKGVTGPEVERRTLDAIRKSLKNPDCAGPEIVYAIAMDVAKTDHLDDLRKRMLLFGVVTYASGQLGGEPVRSQGHIHRISTHSGWSPPKLYEIWTGQAIILMQETANDDPGRCFAVEAKPGEVVVVPPGWAHATISASRDQALTFGAWCDREYGFDYDDVKKHHGLAWYPLYGDGPSLEWMHNPNYVHRHLSVKKPNDYSALGMEKGVPIYAQYEASPDRFQWVSKPALKKDVWVNFIP